MFEADVSGEKEAVTVAPQGAAAYGASRGRRTDIPEPRRP